MSKYMAKIEEIRKNYRYKKDEMFKRMKVTTFVQLILQVKAYQQQEADNRFLESQASDRELGKLKDGQNGGSGDGSGSPVPSLALTEGDFGEEAEIHTSRSTLQSVIKGIGEFDVGNNSIPPTPSIPKSEEYDNPYLLLDLRDSDAYKQCHLITAKNYPSAMLSRSVNNFTKDILAYKNKTGKIIVMYDEDERIGPMAATTFVERDFNNTFLLSGGLKLVAEKFPTGLTTGMVPSSCRPPPPPQMGKKKPKERPPEPIRPANQTDFTDDDLDKLQGHLETCLAPSDTGTRLSRQTPQAQSLSSTVSTARSGTASSRLHSSHWK
ncbi:centrosomal protein of 41 kDa-like [Acanthaster planci]|uniref:Centrosomal protein of 41 kDa-like n=1 Tax=Acanthaster planci TaxID=133434 RepID=A0A8B7Z7P1_ACAPL|nr:centrosomal protein of 41 kDa-like [Acanthaster planci]XP_022099321.1 centrosomal protein of 41 kDa-like [Acanthaster planci]XP_022099322.1 centrosomal protein of 41 kDa-like [Acanthaster planci]